jgi:hypothetical protein
VIWNDQLSTSVTAPLHKMAGVITNVPTREGPPFDDTLTSYLSRIIVHVSNG